MMSPEEQAERDSVADALAAIEATHRQDGPAMWVILRNCDKDKVITVLARVAEDLLTDLADWLSADMADMLGRQREGWLGDE